MLWKLCAIVVKLTFFCCCVREFSLHELQLDAFVGFLCAVITPIHDIFLMDGARVPCAIIALSMNLRLVLAHLFVYAPSVQSYPFSVINYLPCVRVLH